MHDRRPAPFPRIRLLLVLLSASGCATVGEQGQPIVPTRYQTRTGPYAVFSNFPIAADAPSIRCLQTLESDMEATLGLRVKSEQPAVEVYILNDRQTFDHFLKFYYPELPPRRAFFLAQGTQRVVYTFLGDRLEEDLRHEATHALLHVAIGDLPLWLDEGLAEYFEAPDNHRGLNTEHIGRLPQDIALGWAPDLARLESIKSVREMTTRDYRESWAWVHFLLNSTDSNKVSLLGYLADLHTATAQQPLSVRLPESERTAGTRLLAHVQGLRTQPVASSPTATDTTVRLQSQPIEPAHIAPPPRRGFFGRIGALFGL